MALPVMECGPETGVGHRMAPTAWGGTSGSTDVMGLGGGAETGSNPARWGRRSGDRQRRCGGPLGASAMGPAGGGAAGGSSAEDSGGAGLKRAGKLLCGAQGREVGGWYKFLLFVEYRGTFIS
jgi:hypothetical protein